MFFLLLLNSCLFLSHSLEEEEEERREEELEVEKSFFFLCDFFSLSNERGNDYNVLKRQSRKSRFLSHSLEEEEKERLEEELEVEKSFLFLCDFFFPLEREGERL